MTREGRKFCTKLIPTTGKFKRNCKTLVNCPIRAEKPNFHAHKFRKKVFDQLETKNRMTSLRSFLINTRPATATHDSKSECESAITGCIYRFYPHKKCCFSQIFFSYISSVRFFTPSHFFRVKINY